jgi:Fe-S cluster biogenesis protein NfuA
MSAEGGVAIMRANVETVLEKVRPALQADGGDVELVDVEGGVVKVRLTGACSGCPMASVTLKNGIEALLKKEIPSIDRVESV